MTFEEWCEEEGYHPSEIDHGAELWEAATRAEREACASLCEDAESDLRDPFDGMFNCGEGQACANKIRARGES